MFEPYSNDRVRVRLSGLGFEMLLSEAFKAQLQNREREIFLKRPAQAEPSISQRGVSEISARLPLNVFVYPSH